MLIALVVLAWSTVATKVLLACTVLLVEATTTCHHSLGLLLSIEDHQLLTELLVRHAKLLSNLDKASKAIDVIRVIVMDLLVHLECLVEKIHPAVAGGDHELPLDLLGLDLRCSLEVKDSLLEHVLLGIVHTKARDDINLSRVVSITFLVVVNSLELILLLLVEVTHLGKDFRVSWNLGHEDVVPFESLSSHSDKLINMSDLIDDFIAVWNDSVKFLESLKTLVVVVKSLVNQSKVVDSFDAISLDTDSFKEELFSSVVVLEIVEAVTLVDEGL